jgi:hypothetical protein
MKPAEMVTRLAARGWVEESVADLPRNRLNAGAKACLSYKGRLSLRYHPGNGYIRLMIYGHGDERCFQIDYEDRLEPVLEHILSVQDDLSLDTYLSQYLAIQAICPVSILMVEQFL